jgi:site-specific DNA recombinase
MNLRKEPLESAFEEFLGNLVPQKKDLQVLRSELIEAYRERRKTAERELDLVQREISGLEKKVIALHEALVFEKSITKETHDSLLTSLQNQLTEKRIQRNELEEESLDFESLLDQALRALSNTRRAWKEADLEKKISIQRAVFPVGVTVSKDLSFGNPENSLQIDVLGLWRVPNSQVAVPRGIEPRFDG